jgi:hypothetical protein
VWGNARCGCTPFQASRPKEPHSIEILAEVFLRLNCRLSIPGIKSRTCKFPGRINGQELAF